MAHSEGGKNRGWGTHDRPMIRRVLFPMKLVEKKSNAQAALKGGKEKVENGPASVKT